MATQASAVTFLSTPGQGFASGLGFVQIYFGMPIALIIIAAVFLPIYRRLNVITAYEYLGQRFDAKTRLLGAAIFLLQRGLGAGITIYAPAIVLSTVFGWRLDADDYLQRTGGDRLHRFRRKRGGERHPEIPDWRDLCAEWLPPSSFSCTKLPAGLGLTDALTVAGGMHKLEAVNFSTRSAASATRSGRVCWARPF